MYKATRDLINARQPHAVYDVEVVKVRNVGGGVAGQADKNAIEMIKSGAATGMLSGWLVAPVDKETGSTAIVSHYWNFKDGKCFDTTPGIPSDFEYVLDRDLQQYYVDHHLELLDECVSMSLYYKDGKYQLIDGIDGVAYPFGGVDELTTEALFDRGSRTYRFYYAMNLRHAA